MRTSLQLVDHQPRAAIAPEVVPPTEPENSPFCFVIHYYVERRGNQWQAFSLEFGLAAQGDTREEVESKLDSMIDSYLYDALEGEDREHAYELLTRRAT